MKESRAEVGPCMTLVVVTQRSHLRINKTNMKKQSKSYSSREVRKI